MFLIICCIFSTQFDELPKCINNVLHFPDGRVGGPCYENGAVSTEVPICSDVGVSVLRQGGNAMDAAVASCICVGIINSFSSGIGGGGFMLIKSVNDRREYYDSVDFRETAPSKASNEQYQRDKSSTKKGGRAVGVPGEVKGLYEAHKKYGKMKWKNLFKRNIEIANGFVVSEQLHKRLERLKECIFDDPGLKEIYTINGKIARANEVIRRKNYAKTLQIIRDNPEEFYSGKLASDIVKAVKKEGSVMDLDDLKNYKAIFRKPLTGEFLDYTIHTISLPASGLFIIEALNILENFDVKDLKKQGENAMEIEKMRAKLKSNPNAKISNPSKPSNFLGISEDKATFEEATRDEINTAEITKLYPHYHLLVEVYKFMTAKRGLMADPKYIKDPQHLIYDIIDKETAKGIANKINFNKTLPEDEYGFTGTDIEDHGTTHLNVTDSDGNFVLITSTVNLEFGAKFMCPTTGIIFNDEIDDFYVTSVKNAFDLAGMKKNIIEPGKRPFSSAAPMLLEKNNEIIALGAAGGTRIPTSIIGVIFHMMLGKSLSDAIEELRIHNQFHPNKTYTEPGLDKDIIAYLNTIGHKTEESALNAIFTSVQGLHVIMDGDTKIIEAVSDRRKGGLALGY